MILKLKKISKKINFLKSTDHVNYNNFETIVCSNGTSAVIDCLINKLKFCTIKSNDTIDMFAFDDKIKSKIQLSNDNEIISFIKKNFKYKQNILDLDLNESLIKWKKIIQSFKYN